MEKLADGAITVIEDCLTTLKNGFEEPADLPIFSTLYEFVMEALGEQEELTFINAVALLVAIPLVEVSRIAGQGFPFDGGSHGLDSPDLFPTLVAGMRSATAGAGGDRATITAEAGSPAPQPWLYFFAKVGALIASVAGTVQGFIDICALNSELDARRTRERQPLLQPKPAPMWKNILDAGTKVSLVLSAVRQLMTIPVPDPKVSDPSYVLLAVAWGIGAKDFIRPYIGKP